MMRILLITLFLVPVSRADVPAPSASKSLKVAAQTTDAERATTAREYKKLDTEVAEFVGQFADEYQTLSLDGFREKLTAAQKAYDKQKSYVANKKKYPKAVKKANRKASKAIGDGDNADAEYLQEDPELSDAVNELKADEDALALAKSELSKRQTEREKAQKNFNAKLEQFRAQERAIRESVRVNNLAKPYRQMSSSGPGANPEKEPDALRQNLQLTVGGIERKLRGGDAESKADSNPDSKADSKADESLEVTLADQTGPARTLASETKDEAPMVLVHSKNASSAHQANANPATQASANPSTPAASVDCSAAQIAITQAILKNPKNSQILSDLVNIAALKMALRLSSDPSTQNMRFATLETFAKVHASERSSKEFESKLVTFYEDHGIVADRIYLNKLNQKNLNYRDGTLRLSNENSSALILSLVSGGDSPTDFNEADAAAVWAQGQVLNAKAAQNSDFSLGKLQANQINFSSQVYAYVNVLKGEKNRNASLKRKNLKDSLQQASDKLAQVIARTAKELGLSTQACPVVANPKDCSPADFQAGQSAIKDIQRNLASAIAKGGLQTKDHPVQFDFAHSRVENGIIDLKTTLAQ